jgi:probable F420-dependent oxidoreductase
MVATVHMKIGFFLPHMGQAAEPSSIVRVARRAEELGYDSVWVTERLLYPVDPKTSYYGGPLPEVYKRIFDPLMTLTFVAAQTSRICLGTSVLDIPFYNPVLLARQLTALDVLSAGRLKVGLGLGWSADEYEATGADSTVRGARADEFLKVLLAIWTTDPAEFHGRFFSLPRSIIQPKPVQKPHPPLYLAASSPPSLRRAATFADGWLPVGATPDQLRSTSTQLASLAREAGRDPKSIKVVARYNVVVTQKTRSEGMPAFTGTLDQIRADATAVKAASPDELILDSTFSPDVKAEGDFMRHLEEFRRLA